MRIAAGRVVGNGDTVELHGERLPTGGRVTVYFEETDGEYVDEEAKVELLESIAEADRGETRPEDDGLLPRRILPFDSKIVRSVRLPTA